MDTYTPRLPSTQYDFGESPSVEIPRCQIRRPSTYKTTMNAGLLYPVFLDEVLPGDTFTLDVSMVARLMPTVVPFMDNLYLDVQFFSVPNRLVWKNFQKMCGEQENPGDSTDYTFPYVSCPVGGVPVGSLADYFGLPTGVQWDDHDVMALPFRAYNLVWNEWYRDQDLQSSVTVTTDDSVVSVTSFSLLPRGKRSDYFTRARPWAQKGDEVLLPLGGSAPVVGNGLSLGLSLGASSFFGLQTDRATSTSGSYGTLSAVASQYGKNVGNQGTSGNGNSSLKALGVTTDPAKSGLVADLSGASAATVNALREAFQFQKLLERDTFGTRYTEILRSHFGVISPDARLQRPELLGSFTIPIQMHTVAQTSQTDTSGTPQGNLTGYGLGTDVNRAFSKSFVEHGYIIGLASIRGDLTYQQGIPRMWSRADRLDIYWPALAHLGNQPILNKEIFAQDRTVVDSSGNKVNDAVFGYQERWSEYKYGINKVTGELRSQYAQSLDVWHLAQNFGSLPTLGDVFIRENPPVDRVLAVSDGPQFLLDCYMDLTCVRPMPLYSTPGLIDHF